MTNPVYSKPAAAQSAVGLGNLNIQKAQQRHSGAFFVLASMVGCVGPLRRAGLPFGPVSNLMQSAACCLETAGGGYPTKRRPSMHQQSKIHTEAINLAECVDYAHQFLLSPKVGDDRIAEHLLYAAKHRGDRLMRLADAWMSDEELSQ